MGRVIRPRRSREFVLKVSISNCRVFRRILWTARTLHEASEAISLASNPLISDVLIKRCGAASKCGAMIVADMNPEGCEKEERMRGVTDDHRERVAASTLEYNHSMVHSHILSTSMD
jgi:hypothetical protein